MPCCPESLPAQCSHRKQLLRNPAGSCTLRLRACPLCTFVYKLRFMHKNGLSAVPWGLWQAVCSHTPSPRHDDRPSLEVILCSLVSSLSAQMMTLGENAGGPVQTLTQ